MNKSSTKGNDDGDIYRALLQKEKCPIHAAAAEKKWNSDACANPYVTCVPVAGNNCRVKSVNSDTPPKKRGRERERKTEIPGLKPDTQCTPQPTNIMPPPHQPQCVALFSLSLLDVFFLGGPIFVFVAVVSAKESVV